VNVTYQMEEPRERNRSLLQLDSLSRNALVLRNRRQDVYCLWRFRLHARRLTEAFFKVAAP